MRKVKKNSIILLGIFIFLFGFTIYANVMTVWDPSSIEVKDEAIDEIPNVIRDPQRPKTSAIYDYNLTVDNLPGSGITWADRVSEAWCSGSGTVGDPYLISGDTIMFNNSLRGEYACINISNSHDVYFKISGVTVRNNASDVGIGIGIINSTNGIIDSVNASYNGNNGIYFIDSRNITIDDSIINSNQYSGISMDNTTLSTITNTTMNSNGIAGTSLINSTYNLFQTSCNFNDNTLYGIFLFDSDLNNVTACNFYNNTAGLLLQDSDDCVITSNDVEDNSGAGFAIIENDGNSQNNTIYGNDFDTNAILNAQDNGSLNVWDDGVGSGNEWDDAFSSQGIVDLDDDGIGDTPYDINGTAGAQDNYPILDDGDDIAPVITIVNPYSNMIYNSLPRFSLTIVEAVGIYNRWYTLDRGATNITFTGTTGTINSTEWARITGYMGLTEDVTIEFYVNDTAGNIGSATVRIKKYFPTTVEHGEPSEDVYMYALSKNQIYVLLAFSFSLSIILRVITLRITKKR